MYLVFSAECLAKQSPKVGAPNNYVFCFESYVSAYLPLVADLKSSFQELPNGGATHGGLSGTNIASQNRRDHGGCKTTTTGHSDGGSV